MQKRQVAMIRRQAPDNPFLCVIVTLGVIVIERLLFVAKPEVLS